jgi:hypothetical protein
VTRLVQQLNVDKSSIQWILQRLVDRPKLKKRWSPLLCDSTNYFVNSTFGGAQSFIEEGIGGWLDLRKERKKVFLTSMRLKIAYGIDCFSIWLLYSALFL